MESSKVLLQNKERQLYTAICVLASYKLGIPCRLSYPLAAGPLHGQALACGKFPLAGRSSLSSLNLSYTWTVCRSSRLAALAEEHA